MRVEELEKQIEFLMSAAVKKCGDVSEAEELTQETLLAALAAMAQGKEIENLRGWLLTVLNRRFYDRMRKKYRQPYVSMDSDWDFPVEEDLAERVGASEEAESVRREVAFLAKSYRDVVVRHYMDGENVAHIAAAMKLPEGTVKRRLYTGRDQIKKGLSDMKSYTRMSYQPVKLLVYNSGVCGMNGEPGSLVQDDLIAQNLLWLAYAKPVTLEELTRAIGIPTAYVEPVMEKLVNGELLKRVGNRYYTDFMISTVEEQEKYIPAQKKFVEEHFDLVWKGLADGLEKVRANDLYRRGTFDQRNSLEMYFVMKCLENGYFGAFDEIYKAEQVLPERPNGGHWIAMGSVYFGDFDPGQHKELTACRWSGVRWVRLEDYGEAKQIMLHVYGLEGFSAPAYYHCFDDIPTLPRTEGADTRILKLLYLVHSGLRPNQIGFNTEALKAIPMLIKCRILRRENDRLAVNVPVIKPEEFQWLFRLCRETARTISGNIREQLAAFCRGKEQSLPAHLDSVPLQKKYLWSMSALVLATVREAIKRGGLYDGDYDNESGENPPPCPMLLTIEEG